MRQATTHRTQQALLQQVAAENEEAFGQLYRLYFNRLLQYGCLLHPHREVVEDVVQELFLWLAQNRHRLTAIDNFEVYAYQALKRNLFSQVGRSRSKQHSRDRFLAQSPYPTISPSYEQSLIEAEGVSAQHLKLVQALQKLPAYQQEVIYLRYYEGMDYAEIAEILVIRVQVARNYASKAIKKLREQVNGLGKVLHIALILLAVQLGM